MTQTVIARGGDWVPEGMDYQAYRKAGYSFALRYVVPSIPGKMVTAAEVSDAHAAGVDVGFIYETTGTTWMGGFNAGVADGKAAQDAMVSIAAPPGTAVYHAVDSQVVASEMPTVIQWVTGLQKSMTHYVVGVYGQYSVMQAVANAYPHIRLWQTAAWSAGAIYPALELFQDAQVTVGGIVIDTDSLFDSDAGFWPASPPPPPPPILPKEVNMFLLRVTGKAAVYLYDGDVHHITSPANEAAFSKILPIVEVDETQFEVLSGGIPA